MAADDFICPHCGAEVPAKARACPECGADEKTGWSDDTIYDGTGIESAEDFDYAEWERQEGLRPPRRRRLWVWVAGVLLLAWLLVWLVR